MLGRVRVGQGVGVGAGGADPDRLADAYAAAHLPVAAAAAGGLVDEVIAPGETRERVAFALEAGR